MFDWLKGLMPSFDLGSILMWGLLLTGLYFVAKIPGVQNFLGDMIGKLPADWQANISGLLNKIGIDVDMGKSLEAMDYATLHDKLKDQASPEILDIIDPKDGNKTLHEFLDVIRGANGGKVTLKGFTSAETITALIKQKPEMARALVIAALKPGADGKPSATASQMSASIKALIASPQLDELLNPANRANTIHILAAALPKDVPMSEAGLNAIITKGLDANGKPTDALRQLFNNAIDGQTGAQTADGAATSNTTAAIMGDVTKIVGVPNMVMLADVSKIKGDAAKYVIGTIQQDAKAKAAYTTLVTSLGDGQTAAFVNALQSPDAGNQIAQLLLTKQNVHALPQAVALLDALPQLAGKLPHDQAGALNAARTFLTPAHIPAITNIVNNGIKPLVLQSNFLPNGQFSMDHAVDLLLNPDRRHELSVAGTANLAALAHDVNPMASQRNLDAIIRAAGMIDGGNASANSKQIMHALAKIMSGKASMHDAFQNLKGAQLAAFFSNPANRAAFATLLDAKNGIVGNTPAMQQELALLRKDFDKGNGVGIGAILSDKDSAQFLLDHDGGTGIAMPEFVERGAMWISGGNALKNGANQDILLELGKALSGSGAAAAPAPAPAKPRGQSAPSH